MNSVRLMKKSMLLEKESLKNVVESSRELLWAKWNPVRTLSIHRTLEKQRKAKSLLVVSFGLWKRVSPPRMTMSDVQMMVSVFSISLFLYVHLRAMLLI